MDKELRYQLDLLKAEEEGVRHKKKKKKSVLDVDNETLKQLEGIIKSEPIDVDDDDYYYVLVIDEEKKKSQENQDVADKIKIELVNETENEVNEQTESQDSHFDESFDTFLLSNSKVSDKVPATILENEEIQENEYESMDVETENATEMIPHLIQTQDEIDSNEDSQTIMEQISSNTNIIKILTNSGNERTLMVKNDNVKYSSDQQYITIEGDEVTSQEEVILCEGDDATQYKFLNCDSNSMVIEYDEDSEFTTVMQQEDGTFICECGEHFQDLIEYQKHQHQHNPGGEHLCNLCGKGFETSEILVGHMLLHSVTGPLVTCPFCKQLIRRNSLTQHIKYVHNNKPRCTICFKTFANQHNLKRHMMIHNDIREFECDICLRRFHQKITMQTHRLNHLNAFSCNQCDMTFKSKEALTTHRDFDECSKSKMIKAKEELMKTVKQEIKTSVGKVLGYACSLCKKMFSLESALEQHIESTHIVESNEFTEAQKIMRNKSIKRFECSICGKSCASQAMLTMHERVHTNERPFPCQLCPLRFKTKTHLRTHQLTHTREKKFGCSVCMKYFALKGNLVVHLRTHTGERPYVCSICGEGFIDSKYLKKHKLKKHSNDSVAYIA